MGSYYKNGVFFLDDLEMDLDGGGYDIANIGAITTVRATTPGIVLKDSDCTDSDDNVQIYANATATAATSEVIDVYFRAQGAAGTAGQMDTFMQWDGSAQSLILPLSNDAVTPTFAFGDGDSGFHESVDDNIRISIAGVDQWYFSSSYFGSLVAGGAVLVNTGVTATMPGYTFEGDGDTGIGRAAADALSLIAGGVEAMRFTEASSAVLEAVQANVGLTAHTDSIQGAGVITSSHNVYTTVANAGDAATLPATFIVGTIVVIKNDAAANAMDIFPASGDDLGAGADTALSLVAGKGAMFLATVADTTWTNILEGI